MDSATNRGDPFMDIRVRFSVGGNIGNIHLFAIPLTKSHTKDFMFRVVQYLLRGILGINWWKKRLSVATSGDENMTCCDHSSVRMFQ